MKKLLLACMLLTALVAQAATELAGVKFDDKAVLGNTELQLNGAGMRSRFFIKVYVVGLYLGEKKTLAADVLAQKGAKRLRIVTLRELTAEQFVDALFERLHKNLSDAELEPLKTRLDQFRADVLALKDAPKSAVIDLDWLPESGTRLVVNNAKKSADIPGEDFYQALLRIWIGEHPAQGDLKDALLGK